jgi:VWFA-related protein
MKTLLFVLMCAAVVAAPAAQTQTPPASSPAPSSAPQADVPTFRAGVDVLAVDVAVVDDRGDPVDDLHAADFTVKIDGELRRVVSASLVRFDIERARTQAADRSETFYTTNTTPPIGRQIVVAIDQVNIRPGAIRVLMKAAQRFVDKLSPLDQIALVTFPEPGPHVGFTSDHLRIKLAMESLIGHQAQPVIGLFNIGLTEAIAIADRRDQLMLIHVAERECRQFAGSTEQCQRDLIDESSQISLRAREETAQSLLGMRTMLEQLALVDGPKSLILISEGLAIDRQSDLDPIARAAAVARASLNVMMIDVPSGDVAISRLPPSEIQDRQLYVQGLQNLATLTRGALYHVVGTGEGIFDRLASEISAYYVLGVEQGPRDREGDRHRIDVQVGRRNVTIRSRQAFVLSSPARHRRSVEDSLRDALSSPFAISGLPIRVTTFAQQDPSSEKVRMTIAADIGEPGAPPGTYLLGYLLVDRENQIVASYGDRRTLTPASGAATEPLAFVGGVMVDPGIYSLRFAAVDAEGRRGSAIREANAWKMAGQELATGDLIVGNAPEPNQGIRAGVEPHVSADALAAYLELYSTLPAALDGATVTFEIAENADSAALTSFAGRMAPGVQPTWRTATGIAASGALPPGHYVVRAQVKRDGQAVSVLTRPFILEAPPAGAGRLIAAAAAPAFAPPPLFDRDAVLQRDFVATMLDSVETRSPALKASLAEARAGRYGAAALEALTAGDQPAAAFMRGLDLYAKGRLNDAATQLQLAAGPRRDFFPAAVYLGACYAAAGRDRDAAGVWQFAIGTEPRPAAVHILAADARLRDGQPGSAADILKPAYERSPADDELSRRLALAYVMAGHHAEALPVLGSYLSRHGADQELLFAAVLAHYEASRAGQIASTADRAQLQKYAAAYKGPHAALVAKYLETMGVR